MYGEWLDADAEYEVKLTKSWYLIVYSDLKSNIPGMVRNIRDPFFLTRNLIPATRNLKICESNATDLRDVSLKLILFGR